MLLILTINRAVTIFVHSDNFKYPISIPKYIDIFYEMLLFVLLMLIKTDSALMGEIFDAGVD